jgi:hypothetical protein
VSLTVSRESVTELAFAQPAQGIYVSSYLYILYMCPHTATILQEVRDRNYFGPSPKSTVVCVPRLIYLSIPLYYIQLGSSAGYVCPHKTILRLSCPACIRVLILLYISSCYTCSSSVYVCAAVLDGVAEELREELWWRVMW